MQAAVAACAEATSVFMLYLASYCFLLRLPSKALPMARGDAGCDVLGQSVLWMDGWGHAGIETCEEEVFRKKHSPLPFLLVQ